jgi:hypothetical protein
MTRNSNKERKEEEEKKQHRLLNNTQSTHKGIKWQTTGKFQPPLTGNPNQA